jgi:hypothetical protein
VDIVSTGSKKIGRVAMIAYRIGVEKGGSVKGEN